MSISRNVIEGPAVIEFDGEKYYTTDTATLTPDLAMHELQSSYYGVIDRRVTDKVFNLTFTPVGMFSIPAAKYYPYSYSDVGKLIAPSPDKSVTIWTSGGVKLVFPAGVISQSPQLNLGVGLQPMGQMSIACMGDLSKADAADEAHYIISTAAIDAHTLDPTKITTPAYKLVFGKVGAEAADVEIDSEEGFTFDPGVSLTPRKVNALGTINYRLSALAPSISFAPFGQTESEMLDRLQVQGSGAARLGQSNSLGRKVTLKPRNVADLGVEIEFADAQLTEAALQFGADAPRHGTYTLTPVLKAVAGVVQATYTITFPTFGGGGGGGGSGEGD